MRLRALVGSLSILSSYHRVLTSRTVRSRDARSRQRKQQRQWRHGSGNSSSSRDHVSRSPLRSRTHSYQPLRPTFCRVHRSLSLSSSRFLSACRREGAASINGGGRAFTVGLAYRLRLGRAVGIIKPTQA